MAGSRSRAGKQGRDGAGAPPARPGDAGARRVRKDGRIKTTQLLRPHLARELGAVAGQALKQRSEIVCDALEAYLPKFAVVRTMRRAAPDPADGPAAGAAATGGAPPAGAGEGGAAGAGGMP